MHDSWKLGTVGHYSKRGPDMEHIAKTVHIVCKRAKEDAIRIAVELCKTFGNSLSIFIEEETARKLGYDKTFEM